MWKKYLSWPCFHMKTKNQFQVALCSKCQDKTTDLLKEKIWEHLHDLGKDFSNRMQKVNTVKRSTESDYVEIKKFCLPKDTLRGWKGKLYSSKSYLLYTYSIKNLYPEYVKNS